MLQKDTNLSHGNIVLVDIDPFDDKQIEFLFTDLRTEKDIINNDDNGNSYGWTAETFKDSQYKRAKSCADLMNRMRKYYIKHPSECLHLKYSTVTFMHGWQTVDYCFKDRIINAGGDDNISLALYRCPFCDKLL